MYINMLHLQCNWGRGISLLELVFKYMEPKTYETDIHSFFDISIYSQIRVHNMVIKVIVYQR